MLMRRAKIVCTIGPATSMPDTLAALIDAGMDVARLNTSHGRIDEHAALAKQVRRCAKERGRHVGVLMDLGGPKLRTALNSNVVLLQEGDTVIVAGRPDPKAAIQITYPALEDEIQPGERVLIDDGNIELVIEDREAGGLRCRVRQGGRVSPGKGVAFPDSELGLSSLTGRDEEAIRAGVAANVDFFALSFVQNAADVRRARETIRAAGGNIPIIAKIERRQALMNLDEIMLDADGVMVARGDLGVELPPEDVPVRQRRIIRAAAQHLRPVITATQMLESMVRSRRPTRAESSDVANAVWDLSDALMLSEETAVGEHPLEAVRMMDRIIRTAEADRDAFREPIEFMQGNDSSYIVALAAKRIVDASPNVRGVVVFTRTGRTAFLMSKVHPGEPIYALSPSEQTCRRLSLARGVIPIQVPESQTSEDMLRMLDKKLVEEGYLQLGQDVVMVASLPVKYSGPTNFLKLHRLGESAGYW